MITAQNLKSKTVGLCCMVALAVASCLTPEAHAADQAGSAATDKVPTTRILAIGSFTRQPTKAQLDQMVPQEVSDTAWLAMDGKIDQWFARQDEEGVVFLMNVKTPDEAHALLEKLPLGRAGLMKFQLIPVGPLWPLTYLMRPRPKP
ncbi:hypothetical protein SAMN02800694_2802 [Luteibacter sp. UNCMF331Sha3.1]|uniref:hypothetical protein n=1 Tax=Luteibacter sp. UNCMF331Sha3.1 TaxID=1502760 RepID=UPI0008B0B8AF|nr:hypothetical protein [Luteibacter sp. UNCMF331Sha3.1]SEN11066.1 hypothetical protein SAMN02800694_2802 [Luteibacter sp. UNCMF331Sha3.1]